MSEKLKNYRFLGDKKMSTPGNYPSSLDNMLIFHKTRVNKYVPGAAPDSQSQNPKPDSQPKIQNLILNPKVRNPILRIFKPSAKKLKKIVSRGNCRLYE